MKTETTPIQRACGLVGGQAALARMLSVTPAAINHWVTKSREVPIARCVEIERLTNGAVTRKDLRPDDWHLIWPDPVAAEAG